MATNRSSLETTFHRIWQRRGALAYLLWPLSMLFLLLSSLRRFGYRRGWLKSVRVPLPVIVVGNIFIGGTGKTPFTIWLVDILQQAGYRPGVVSRGHGRDADDCLEVTDDSDPRLAGDEPVLIAMRTKVPVFISRQRPRAADALMRAHPNVNVIVSDDGLQHYALARDMEIVLFDKRGVGNGWLLPAGPLREPASRRRDFTVINSAEPLTTAQNDFFSMQLIGDSAQRLSDASQTLSLSALPANDENVPRIVAAAGIGNPARFFSTLRGAGLHFEEMPLPDHYDFTADSFTETQAELILITEKDAVKCRRISALVNDRRIWVVPVTAHIDHALADKIVEKLRGHPTA